MNPAPFLRGAPFASVGKAPYPRARPDDFLRLPVDTWAQAQIPVGVRLEMMGDAEEIEIAYRCESEEISWRGAGGAAFALWRGGECFAEGKAERGEGAARLPFGASAEASILYLPEWMKPEVLSVTPLGGSIEPAPPQPRWVCYGDSIAEGWVATAAALAWPAIAGRDYGFDVFNLGYAGAARGELTSAEHVAGLPSEVISISHGTNCWSRIPFDAALMRENTRAFIEIVRQAHPETPVLVQSPILRPSGESAPNRLGATLQDLRAAMEEAVRERIAAGDAHLTLVAGRDLINEELLADDVHPSDDGHRALAAALGPRLRELVA